MEGVIHLVDKLGDQTVSSRSYRRLSPQMPKDTRCDYVDKSAKAN